MTDFCILEKEGVKRNRLIHTIIKIILMENLTLLFFMYMENVLL